MRLRGSSAWRNGLVLHLLGNVPPNVLSTLSQTHIEAELTWTVMAFRSFSFANEPFSAFLLVFRVDSVVIPCSQEGAPWQVAQLFHRVIHPARSAVRATAQQC